MLAEELSASGILAVVAAGLALGHNSPHASYESRIQEREFWSTLDTLLESFVFAYIGLQFRFVIGDALASGFEPIELIRISAITLAAVIAVRIGWIFLTAVLRRWFEKLRLHLRRRIMPQQIRELPLPPPLTWRENLVLSWTGMRGVVTLAAAGGIPFAIEGGDNFVGRNAIVAVAFVVTIGTLLLQGNTLPLLINRLDLSDEEADGQRTEEFKRARDLAREAAVEAIESFSAKQSDPEARKIAQRMLERVKSQSDESNPAWAGQRETTVVKLSRIALEARRRAVIEARDNDDLDDEVVREVLKQMDREQAVADNWSPERYEQS
jgi:CPA1 family monovalent cation:H+ antiporter